MIFRRGTRSTDPAGTMVERRGAREVGYWRTRRFWSWLLSFRATLLVFLDTFVSVLFGQNVLRSAALSDTIVRLQWSLIRTADRVRDDVTTAVRRALIRKSSGGGPRDEDAVRVNISVLSNDRMSAFYISWSRGSLVRKFGARSVAWVAMRAGEARWWMESYRSPLIVLLDNSAKRIPVGEGTLMLKEYFQPRETLDYEAFIVLPVPRNVRALTGEYRQAAIHISFAMEADLKELWPDVIVDAPAPDTKEPINPYKKAAQAFDGVADLELRAVLHQAADVLGEVLREFNQAVFELHIRPRLLS